MDLSLRDGGDRDVQVDFILYANSIMRRCVEMISTQQTS